MADFVQTQQQLSDARTAVEKAQAAEVQAAAALKAAQSRQAAFNRTFNAKDPAKVKAQADLNAQVAQLAAAAQKATTDRLTAQAAETTAQGLFVALNDPRSAIANWKDRIPILLFPVRLETRFKTIGTPIGAVAPKRELWVRIFPDDCSIDTFDPTLSATELAAAKTFWARIWEAGGDEDLERAAFRDLCSGRGTGRAEWILKSYVPKNLADKKPKTVPGGVILAIPTDTPLTGDEAASLLNYWQDAWKADGDAQKTAAALQTLVNKTSAARASALIASYAPANPGLEPPAPFTRSQVAVQALYLVLPKDSDFQTKQRAWNQAPKAIVLPDRFLFIGTSGPDQVTMLGNSVPAELAVGPDPSAPAGQQLQQDKNGNLIVPDPLKWMTDFDAAVAAGMGLKVSLTEAQFTRGFSRVLVVGLRLRTNETASKTDLETLINHHRYSPAGIEILPQGTPTNNTEGLNSGYSRQDNPDERFNVWKNGPLFHTELGWLDKKDGEWLAEYLGIDPAVVSGLPHAALTDQADARAMNTALWPATLGYWMESMMTNIFTASGIQLTRDYFNDFVLGRGAIPAIRIGKQPYGILPATALSRLKWPGAPALFEGNDKIYQPLAANLYKILSLMQADWRGVSGQVSFAAKPGDAQQLLLDIVGLHPSSVEFSQRYAESADQVLNRLNLEGLGGLFGALILAGIQQAGMDLLKKLGYNGTAKPDILAKFFFGTQNLLKGPIIDDRPLSETSPIRAYTGSGQNYLEWLIDAANKSLDALYQQAGFINNQPPQALFYLLLRHALQLGYQDVSLLLFQAANLMTADAVRVAKTDDSFIGIRDTAVPAESRYTTLYAKDQRITGNATQTVGDFIGSRIGTLLVARYLRQQVQALTHIKGASTARLERAFAEHIDLCTYRLDAWIESLVHYQLCAMRNLSDGKNLTPQQGIYLGAYAWLENLTADKAVHNPVVLSDADLRGVFQAAADPPLTTDSQNEGFILAPSLDHAVAAAVLRNGYISNASPANTQSMAVNLTSERVRTALGMLEGIRNGQSLGALLGYQFERGLHDDHNLAEVDQFIFKIRKEFPLAGDRLISTRTAATVPIEAVEARNVADGLALINQMKSAPANAVYPFGKASLPPATPAQAAAINTEAQRLLDTHDAVADLALAEGVYQAVCGNYDRVGSTLDAYAKGNFPPEPQVIRTPATGAGQTHRVTLHLKANADPGTSPLTGVAMSPRAQAEPSLNAWLAGVLPDPGSAGCVASYRDANTGAAATRQVTWKDLALQPLDLLHIIRDEPAQAMSELDDRIVRFVEANSPVRPDQPVSIQYLQKTTAAFTFFELLPLMRNLRRLLKSSRPLRLSDLTLMNEAKSTSDDAAAIDRTRVAGARSTLQTLRTDLAAFKTAIDGPLGDLNNRRNEILTGVDTQAANLTTLLTRGAQFGLTQSGWGFIHDFRQRFFVDVLQKCAVLTARFDDKLAQFDSLAAQSLALPATASDQDQFTLLTRAEASISTAVTSPLPATPAAFAAALNSGKRPPFVAKRGQFAGIATTKRTQVSQLLADVKSLLPISAFDFKDFSFAGEETQVITFAQDASRVAGQVIADIDARLASSQTNLNNHDAAASGPDRLKALDAAVKTLFGDDFRILPRFTLPAAQGDEVEQSVAAAATPAFFQYLTQTVKVDFPVDTWLYGVARVREKVRWWEQIVMNAGALGRPEPELTPLQFPFQPGEQWMAMEFPPDANLNVDRLLYHAHFGAAFAKADPQCGLLLDEWSEVIPAASANTGLTFHFDRPNNEAPQAMLLVTPTVFDGTWQWSDVQDALNETLDFAKLRAVEPAQIDSTPYSWLLPATVMAVTVRQLTISMNLAQNNNLAAFMQG